MKIFNYVILVSFCVLNAQSSQRDYNEELRYQNDAINKMKKEIEELSSKLRKANINETTTSKRITNFCLLYTSPSPRDQRGSRMPSSA